MAKKSAKSKLATRTARGGLNLALGQRAQEPMDSGDGKFLAYRARKRAGVWLAYLARNKADRVMQALGMADDVQEADGESILSYPQAKAKALAWFAEQDTQAALGVAPAKKVAPLTVADALEVYFQNGEREGMKGLAGYRQVAGARIVPTLGHIEVAKLTQEQIEGWHAALAESPRKLRKPGGGTRDGEAPATAGARRARRDTANRQLTILKAALNHAVDRKLANVADPCWQRVKRFKGTASARTRFLKPDEQIRLLNACHEQDFRDLVEAALLTGCRYSELARLQCRDVDTEAGTSTIHITESKSGRGRRVVLTPEAAELFEGLTNKRQRPDDLVFQRRTVLKGAQPRDAQNRFAAGGGTPGGWEKSHQVRLMQRACKVAGLEPVAFHELRHTYASGLINAGCPTIYVASQLGHTDTRMVEKHYGHLCEHDKAAALLLASPVLGTRRPSPVQKLKIAAG